MNKFFKLIAVGVMTTAFLFAATNFLGSMEEGSVETTDYTNETHLIDTDANYSIVETNYEPVVSDSEKLYDPYGSAGVNYTVVSYTKGEFNVTDYKNNQGLKDIAFNYTTNSTTGTTQAVAPILGVYSAFTIFQFVIGFLIAAAMVGLAAKKVKEDVLSGR